MLIARTSTAIYSCYRISLVRQMLRLLHMHPRPRMHPGLPMLRHPGMHPDAVGEPKHLIDSLNAEGANYELAFTTPDFQGKRAIAPAQNFPHILCILFRPSLLHVVIALQLSRCPRRAAIKERCLACFSTKHKQSQCPRKIICRLCGNKWRG